MIRTLLVTNDYPPKVGGIQSYLHELWQRLDPTATAVLTASSHPAAPGFDADSAARGLRVERVGSHTLYLPTRGAVAAIDAAIDEVQPSLVLYDPFVPLGLVGVRHDVPYGVVLHGAEVTVPVRLPIVRRLARSVLGAATVVVSAGSYAEDEARRLMGDALAPVVQVPPGVDVERFVPLDPRRRGAVRARFGLPATGPIVTSVGRLVPRKGLDVLIDAAARCTTTIPDLTLVIAGGGRDAARLRRRAVHARARVHFLGRIDEGAKVDLLGVSDVFAQPCRSRWAGLEQEGFGIVFLEAAACGVPQVAGRSGGSFEAVEDGSTGLVVDRPGDAASVASALSGLLGDAERRVAMGAAARVRAQRDFDYDVLARRLQDGLDAAMGEQRAARS